MIALAGAIVVCAVPMGYRISKCPNLNGGLSLNQLISFSCQADKPEPFHSEQHEISREQLSAATLLPPTGYVAYRVDSGVPRASGSLAPSEGEPAPGFSETTVGLILQATAPKRLRQRPYAQSVGTLLPEGQCFQVMHGFRWSDESPTAGKSGGWLPVKTIDCPFVKAAASKVPATQAGARPNADKRKTDDASSLRDSPPATISSRGDGKMFANASNTDATTVASVAPRRSATIFFTFKGATIDGASKSALDSVVAYYKQHREYSITSTAFYEYNEPEDGPGGQTIYPRRAEAAQKYMISQGVPKDRFYGAHYLNIRSNDESTRRRVEIVCELIIPNPPMK